MDVCEKYEVRLEEMHTCTMHDCTYDAPCKVHADEVQPRKAYACKVHTSKVHACKSRL